MPHECVRPAGDQFVIFVQPGVHAELAAEMAHRGPRKDAGEGSADGGAGDQPPLRRRIRGPAKGKSHEDRERLQQQARTRGPDRRNRGPLLVVRRAENKRVPPDEPAHHEHYPTEHQHFTPQGLTMTLPNCSLFSRYRCAAPISPTGSTPPPTAFNSFPHTNFSPPRPSPIL